MKYQNEGYPLPLVASQAGTKGAHKISGPYGNLRV